MRTTEAEYWGRKAGVKVSGEWEERGGGIKNDEIELAARARKGVRGVSKLTAHGSILGSFARLRMTVAGMN